MAAPAAPAESDTTTTHLHNPTSTYYHFPLHLPDEPKVGAHVMYADGGTFRDALVQIVFTEHGMPPITLVVVKPGSRGIVQTKNLVPHMSKRHSGEACWCRPEEVVR